MWVCGIPTSADALPFTMTDSVLCLYKIIGVCARDLLGRCFRLFSQRSLLVSQTDVKERLRQILCTKNIYPVFSPTLIRKVYAWNDRVHFMFCSWGSETKVHTLGQVVHFCPHCDRDTYFSIFEVKEHDDVCCIPCGSRLKGQYAQCNVCGAQYTLEE